MQSRSFRRCFDIFSTAHVLWPRSCVQVSSRFCVLELEAAGSEPVDDDALKIQTQSLGQIYPDIKCKIIIVAVILRSTSKCSEHLQHFFIKYFLPLFSRLAQILGFLCDLRRLHLGSRVVPSPPKFRYRNLTSNRGIFVLKIDV